MKYLFLFLGLLFNSILVGQNGLRAVLTSTFLNKNVYKTKGYLVVTKVYTNGRPATDLRQFTIMPNGPMPSVTVTKVTVKPIAPTTPVGTSSTTTTEVSNLPANSSIPPNTITTTIVNNPSGATTNSTNSSTTTYSVPGALPSRDFIRYKVLYEDADYKYIKILPGCQFSGANPTDTIIQFGAPGVDDPSDYVFQVSKKSLTPVNHYLANSVLVGKILTLPGRLRSEYWNDNNKVFQGSLNINYCFGWKHKLGNNPYNSTYLNVIAAGVGVNQQKFSFVAGKYAATGKDSLSAKTDEFAITYLTFGLALEWEKFNIGIFCGKDAMFGNLKKWVYQDKFWFGIGIGYELFK